MPRGKVRSRRAGLSLLSGRSALRVNLVSTSDLQLKTCRMVCFSKPRRDARPGRSPARPCQVEHGVEGQVARIIAAVGDTGRPDGIVEADAARIAVAAAGAGDGGDARAVAVERTMTRWR